MVYEGNEKYIFVSYAHKDSEAVLPVLEEMSAAGFRFWYDSGIEAGTEWPEYIEERLMNSEVVLVFMTPAAVESRNCRNEINFALELKKEILVIYLEETTLLKGMRLQLNSSQSLFRKHHNSQETFVRELIDARILQGCRDNAPAPVAAAPAAQPQAAKPAQTKAKPGKLPVYVLLGAILAALVILICVIAFGGQSGQTQPTDPTPTVTDQPATEPLPPEMSDDLMDFTVELEGVVYQFPCAFEALTANGWTISSSGCSGESLLAGGSQYDYEMSKNGKTIEVTSYNLSGNAVAIQDCLVAGVSCSVADGVALKLAKDVTLQMTADELVQALGTPNTRDEYSDHITLDYYEGDNGGRVRFLIYTEEASRKYSRVMIENLVDTGDIKTETNPEVPEYLAVYQAPTALGTDFKSAVVSIGGDLYQIPAPVSSFTENGWQIVQQPSYVRSGNYETIRLERDGAKLNLYIANLAEYQTLAENCIAYKFRAEQTDGVTVELPNGICMGISEDAVTSAVNEEFSYYEGSYSHSWSYADYGEEQLSISIEVDVQTNKVDLISVSREYWPE